MAITESEFKNILREAAGSEFAEAVQRRPDFDRAFSDGFEKRMDRLVRSEGRSAWRLFSAAPRRLAFAALAVVLILSTVACTVPGVRQAIGGVYKLVFADHAEPDPIEATQTDDQNGHGAAPTAEGSSPEPSAEDELTVETECLVWNNMKIILHPSSGRDGYITVGSYLFSHAILAPTNARFAKCLYKIKINGTIQAAATADDLPCLTV